MVLKVVITLTSVLVNIVLSQRIDEYILCNKGRIFSPGTSVFYIYYPESKTSPSSCRYLIKSPVNSYITAKIYHNLAGSEPSCATQRVLVSQSGDTLMRDAGKFCGKRMTFPLQINSIGNEMAIELQSKTLSGTLQIVLKYIKITQNNCECSWNAKGRIIGGQDAIANEFVFHAAFKSTFGSFRETICGGAIITQNYVLTAAHCALAIRNQFNWRVSIEVGRNNITAALNQDTIYAATYGISYAIVHTNYNEETNANDIALVRSSTYMKFSRGVGPVCLPFAYENFAVPSGTIMTALGYGSTQFAMSASADKKSWILKKVMLTVNSTLPLCNNSNENKMCAIGRYNSITKQYGDSCQRDSGGGVLGFMKNRYYCFGVVSEGIACGAKNSYTSSTYVPKYLDWIQRNVNNEFLCHK